MVDMKINEEQVTVKKFVFTLTDDECRELTGDLQALERDLSLSRTGDRLLSYLGSRNIVGGRYV